MKLFTMIFLSVFLGKSCSGQSQKDRKDTVLEYTANTRGFFRKITIQNQMISISKNRNDTGIEEKIKLSDANWKELVGYFESIKLDSLPILKSPTEKRFSDGAAIANLKVIYKNKTYETAAFDHGYPPIAIKKLVDKINSFAKKNNEN